MIEFFRVLDPWGGIDLIVCEECVRDQDPYGTDNGFTVLGKVESPSICDQCEISDYDAAD